MSLVPMMRKAYQTKDMTSYSLVNIVLTNVGNLIHSVYVYSLPAGPIWVLHTFYLVAMALMLIWYVRYTLDLRRLMCKLWNTRHLWLHWVESWMDTVVTSLSWEDRFDTTTDTDTRVSRACPS